MISIDPTRECFLELVTRLRSPRRLLEVGSGAGYSALWFLKGMGKKGTLEAIEINSEVAEQLEAVIEKAGLRRRVKVHVGQPEIARTRLGLRTFRTQSLSLRIR